MNYTEKCYIKEFSYKGKPRYTILFEGTAGTGNKVQELCISEVHSSLSPFKTGYKTLYFHTPKEINDVMINPVKAIASDDPNILMSARLVMNEPILRKIFFVRTYSYDEFAKLHPESFI